MAGPQAEYEGDVVGRHDHPDVMTGRHLAVTVVTPKGAVLSRSCDEIVAPGALGELGLLPGHIPLLAAMKPGVLQVRSGTTREVFAVGRGYVQVGARDQVRILVDAAALAADIDTAAVQAEADQLTAELKQATSEADQATLTGRLDWARARLDARRAVAH